MNHTQFPTLMAAFCGLVEAQQKERLARLGYTPGLHNVQVTTSTGLKFIRVDVGTSGKFMVEIVTGNIFGIKGYGQVHRGHFYGTLETVAEYFWGEFYPTRRDGKLALQKANGCPVITKAPAPVAQDVDTVCPDGPACKDQKCVTERLKQGLLTLADAVERHETATLTV